MQVKHGDLLAPESPLQNLLYNVQCKLDQLNQTFQQSANIAALMNEQRAGVEQKRRLRSCRRDSKVLRSLTDRLDALRKQRIVKWPR